MSDDTRATIRQFICGRFPSVSISDTDDIFAIGVATSLFAMELVIFVENTFGFQVPNEELEMANFRSVEAIAALVARQSATVAGGTG
ncbi:hypothetical protein Val02_56900 [Virgisporangium aliadipatigenens]|uniref:Carrier domain-containing protein n=1 Tax=Virgisporangium aliadipatigenens TaxID=741659 RepID=A0A8J4DSK6_9ACTN|nr:phosphopantetheine-binding protein [Virgisporangium aliadipatigenens]GIJ48804.1 hypothetical protein Val02_56900 [Virgisporangium aliadipatigenens]